MRISDWSSDVCSSDLAGAVIEFLQAFLAPAQVVTFFARGIKQVTAGVRIARGQRLAVVQRLRGNLAGMIDAHQAGDVAALVGSQFGIARCAGRSEEHTSELQSIMRTSYSVFCLKKKNNK